MDIQSPKSGKEPILNIDDPAPFWLVMILMLAYLGYFIAPASFKEFVFQAGVLGSNGGTVLLEDRPLGSFVTLLTHTLLHSSWGHVLMNSGMILAFGVITIRGVKRRYAPVMGLFRRGAAVFLAIFLLGAIGGGLGQWLHWSLAGMSGAAVGASTGGAALFASTAWALGGRKRLVAFGLVLIAFDVFNILMGSGQPAWAGHLGGYLTGALLSTFWVKPGSVDISILR